MALTQISTQGIKDGTITGKVVIVIKDQYYTSIIIYNLMLEPIQKKAALESELQQIAKNYQEAQQVMQNC